MNYIKEIAAIRAKYTGEPGVSDSVMELLDEAVRHGVKTARPFKVVRVEFLLPADADDGKLEAALSVLHNKYSADPIVEWRMVPGATQCLSGPEAEYVFKQPDLEYPGKAEYTEASK